MFVRTSIPYPADIRPLTSLRFAAAMVIVVFHLGLMMPFDLAAVSGFFEKGYLGVDFFFILSGFILAHVYLDAARNGTLVPLAFYGRRLARIYPVHLLTMGVALVPYGAALLGGVPQVIPDFFHPGYIASHGLLLHAWGYDDRYALNDPSWSISAEWFAYLLFPFLAVAICRLRPLPAFVTAGLFFGGLYGVVAALPVGSGLLDNGRPLTIRTFDFGIMRILPEFILGMALYRCGRVWAVYGDARWWLGGCVLALAVLMHIGAPDYAVVPLFAVLIYLAAEAARGGDAGVLDRPWMVAMGEASYSLYMTHFLWIQAVFNLLLQMVPGADAVWTRCLCAALLLPVMLWTARLCHRRVEVPWRHKFWSAYSRFVLRE